MYPFLGVKHVTEKLLSSAKLIKDFRIVVGDGRTHSVCLDLQPDLGDDMGPSALELCVMSYVGCFATIFALTAKRMRVPLKALEVDVEALKSNEVGTLTEATLDIRVTADASEQRIQKMTRLTFENCPVGILFEKAGVKTDYTMQITKE
jgi:putative redox protein